MQKKKVYNISSDCCRKLSNVKINQKHHEFDGEKLVVLTVFGYINKVKGYFTMREKKEVFSCEIIGM